MPGINFRYLARRGVVMAVLALCGIVHASSDGGPTDQFISRYETDIDRDRYAAGELGVILPSYSNLDFVLPSYADLYLAWRRILLGNRGHKNKNTHADKEDTHEPEPAMDEPVPAGWVAVDTDTSSSGTVKGWEEASAAYAGPKRPRMYQGMRRVPRVDYSGFVVCSDPAFAFAVDTLQALRKRPDATPERLHSWVSAQDMVFAYCDYDPAPQPKPGQNLLVAPPPLPSAPPVPTPLPDSEPLYWRQMREYQIAAAAFYNDDYRESEKRFTAIGNNPNHPMHLWGAYLALRSQCRSADLDIDVGPPRRALMTELVNLKQAPKETDGAFHERRAILEKKLQQQTQILHEAQLTDITARVNRILADPTLSALHEAAGASLRIAKSRLTPVKRLEELSTFLDDINGDPDLDDHLYDWQILAVAQIGGKANPSQEAELRTHHVFFDWMRSFSECRRVVQVAGPENEQTKVGKACKKRYAYAMERWKTGLTVKSQHAPSRAWLVAALIFANTLPPELEHAALDIPVSAPEYLTVRYNLARLYRLQGRLEQARAVSDAELSSARLRDASLRSSRNLFRQERFASAASTKDALAYMMRELAPNDDDVSAAKKANKPVPVVMRIAADGSGWLNEKLSVGELLAVANEAGLDADIRSQIAVVAWLRADLLGKSDIANNAAALVMKTIPALNTAAQQYRQLASKEQKRHILIVAMLAHNLQPAIISDKTYIVDSIDAGPVKDDVVAGMWCYLPKNGYHADGDPNGYEENPPPLLNVSTDVAARDSEMQMLRQVKTATGYVGDHVVQWAKQHPADVDVPWLLHIVVASTRGGCLDKDSSKLSHTAYSLLHTHYKSNVWTDKTQYWY